MSMIKLARMEYIVWFVLVFVFLVVGRDDWAKVAAVGYIAWSILHCYIRFVQECRKND